MERPRPTPARPTPARPIKAHATTIRPILACLAVIGPGLTLQTLPTRALADPAGTVAVTDGDTIRVGGDIVRLFGIDALEEGQSCGLALGGTWDCGHWATMEMARRFAGAEATCTTRDIDRYGRTVATCRVDGVDIGRSMVQIGAAMAYRAYALDYVADEARARAAGLGIWAGDFVAPADYRETTSQAADRAPQTPPGTCAIKGNISASGQIYHLPGQQNYDETRIDEGRGERWFCSTAEAEAAGWRAARR